MPVKFHFHIMKISSDYFLPYLIYRTLHFHVNICHSPCNMRYLWVYVHMHTFMSLITFKILNTLKECLTCIFISPISDQKSKGINDTHNTIKNEAEDINGSLKCRMLLNNVINYIPAFIISVNKSKLFLWLLFIHFVNLII